MAKPDKTAAVEANTLEVVRSPDEAHASALARTVLRPNVRAALTTKQYSQKFGDLELTALVNELSTQVSAANKGDLSRSEAMLTSQAHTLDAIFHELARLAGLNLGEYINAAEIYMRLALKAQGQCRATLEALAEMKNPRPLTFVKQANVAHGPQQINNGPQTEAPSRARETQNQPNELLERQHGERLDCGAAASAVRGDSALASMGKIHRTANPSG